jgi:T5SS/PEP-CTERM-associated repeat protein
MMKRCNWRLSATTWFKRQGTVALLATVGLAALPAVSHADVVAEGDVTPVGPVALPIDGGTVAGDVVVGGTGTQTDPFYTLGRMVIDVPAFTAPLVSTNGIIGFQADGIGEVVVSGFLSEWQVQEILKVGVEGQAYLEVTGGALIRTNLDAQSTDPDFVVGELLGSQGFVAISGVGSLVQHTDLIVGHRGTGEIVVSNGARLRTLNEAILGEDALSTGGSLNVGSGKVVVTGVGSRWTVVDSLTVGEEGRGEIQALAGGQIRVEEDIIFGLNNTTSTTIPAVYSKAIISGPGTQVWAEENIVISTPLTNAQADVTVADSAILRADSDVVVGEQGFVNLAGGTIVTPITTSAGVIRGYGTVNGAVVNNGDIRNAAGVANIRERLLFTGAVTNNDNIESVGGEMEFKGNVVNNSPDGDIYGKDAIFRFLGPGGLVNNGNVTLDNTLVESTVFTNNAALAVLADDTSTILGDVALTSSSILEMELGDDFSQLWVTGDANISGTLSLSLAPDYNPETGDSFEILRSDALAGTFSAEIMTDNPGLLWDVSYTTSSVFVTFGAVAPPGSGADFNGDNIVDASDLAIWQSNFGLGSNPPPAATQADGDANGDGVVDGADFLLIQQQFGGPPPAVPAFAAVPEPSSVLLALAAFGLPLAARRRRG